MHGASRTQDPRQRRALAFAAAEAPRHAPAVDVEGMEDSVELVVVCEEAKSADGFAELLLRDRSVVVLVPMYGQERRVRA